jgi:hypothetical protein
MRKPYARKELKQRVYRTVRPSLHLETRVAKEGVVSISKLLGEWGENFSVGFRSMIREIREWQKMRVSESFLKKLEKPSSFCIFQILPKLYIITLDGFKRYISPFKITIECF